MADKTWLLVIIDILETVLQRMKTEIYILPEDIRVIKSASEKTH